MNYRPLFVIICVVLLCGAPALATWQVVSPGTQFIATGNNLTVEWLSTAGPSEVDDFYPVFTSNSIEFYNVTIASNQNNPGSIGIYHNQLNATAGNGYTNITTALSIGSTVSFIENSTGTPVPFAVAGSGLQYVNMTTTGIINTTDIQPDFIYRSNAAGSILTIPTQDINTTLGAIAVETGVGLAVNKTTSDGTLVLNMPSTAGINQSAYLSPLGYLEIRSEQEDHPLVTGNVSILFYEELPFSSTTIPVIRRFNTTTGIIDFTDIADYASKEFSIVAGQGDLPGYRPRTALIPSLLDQQYFFVVPEDPVKGVVDTTLQVRDMSGEFTGTDSKIYVYKAIHRAAFDPDNTTIASPYQWMIVTSEYTNSAMSYNSSYIYSDKYRITIKSGDGAERSLGNWIATTDGGLEVLEIANYELTSPDWGNEFYKANATFRNDAIQFGFEDTETISSNLIVNVTSLNNATHPVIFSATSCTPSCGSYYFNTSTLSAGDLAQQPFLVHFSVFRNGEWVGNKIVVGPAIVTSQFPVPQQIKDIFSLGLITVIGAAVAAFSSGGMAILALAIVTGVLSFTGLLSPVVSVPIIITVFLMGLFALYGGRN